MTNAELNEYMPFATLNHLLDWWSLLRAGTESLFSGATNLNIHLAYYAELKGAMSILALHGVFNFNFENIQCKRSLTGCVDDLTKLGTHKAVPSMFSQVISQTDTLGIMVNKIKGNNICGISIDDYIDWLKVWAKTTSLTLEGLIRDSIADVTQLSKDHEERNNNTYPPSNEFKLDLDYKDILTELASFWESLSWNIGGTGVVMETNFNLSLLMRLYDERPWGPRRNANGDEIQETPLEFEERKMLSFTSEMLSIARKHGAPEIRVATLEKTIVQFKSSIFSKYLRLTDRENPRFTLWVTARASMLLFISTSLVQEFIDAPTALWLEKFIASKGIWEWNPKDACDDFIADYPLFLNELLIKALPSSEPYWISRKSFAKELSICNTPEIIPAYLFSR